MLCKGRLGRLRLTVRHTFTDYEFSLVQIEIQVSILNHNLIRDVAHIQTKLPSIKTNSVIKNWELFSKCGAFPKLPRNFLAR